MDRYLHDRDVEGLLFNYLHFYGSYDFVGDSRNWYRREVRIIRNLSGIHSYKDAQGFRRKNKRLRVRPIDAWVYHYGWVKSPSAQQAKLLNFNKYWHSDTWIEEKVPPVSEFDYAGIDSLTRFDGTHPEVMQERIKKMNWSSSFDPTKKKFSFKTRLLHAIEKMTGWRIGEYRNYRV